MPELPKSWGLTTKRREDGKLDVIGKDDSGGEYRVKTCNTGSVTEQDLASIRVCDREQYRSRDEGARIVVNSFVRQQVTEREAQEQRFEDDLIEAAGPVVRAGLERQGSTVGSTLKYRNNYNRVFGG